MTKKPLNQLEGMQDWLKNEINKDKKELEIEKMRFLNEIKNFKKEDIVQKNTNKVKLTIWQKLKKMLMG
jgi:hypothetical protein